MLAMDGYTQNIHSVLQNTTIQKVLNFGALRVLNNNTVLGSIGFDTHSHKDMEIVSIPLEGELKHIDNIGNETVIKSGDIQVMSAGTVVMHFEYNNNADHAVKFLQIGVFCPVHKRDAQSLKMSPN